MKYASQEALLQSYAEFEKAIENSINKKPLRILAQSNLNVMQMDDTPFDIQYTHDLLITELKNNSSKIMHALEVSRLESKLIGYMQEIERRINTASCFYIEDKNGLTRDTRNVRNFIRFHYKSLTSSLLIPAMKLLHTLSLNDKVYYRVFQRGPVDINKDNRTNTAAPVIYSISKKEVSKLDNRADDDPTCRIPGFSKCTIM